jgi:hypothetical protein
MTSDGVYKYDVQQPDARPLLLVSLADILKVLKSQIVPQSKIVYFSESLFLYSRKIIASFSTVDGLANASCVFNGKIRGITVSDENVCHLDTPLKLFEVRFGAHAQLRRNKSPAVDVLTQLRNLYLLDSPAVRFVETVTTLSRNPTLAGHILMLLIDQYASFPEELVAEMSPLLLSSLENYRSVSLEQLR